MWLHNQQSTTATADTKIKTHEVPVGVLTAAEVMIHNIIICGSFITQVLSET
jgi:hypothetical protein